jgi:hypothetical protein
MRSCAAVSRFRPGAAWLHPMGALLSIWFALQAAAQVLRRRPLVWRDRALQNSPPRL